MEPQRVVIAMVDGLGLDYYERSAMPTLRALADGGVFQAVSAMMPTVTNVNNVSICTGRFPDEHGISGNSWYDPLRGDERYMDDQALVRVETVLTHARSHAVKSALLTAKGKTVKLLGRGAERAIAAESASADLVDRWGPPGDIYSREINYWLWGAAADLLKSEPDIRLFYVHTTDYPMHRWGPEDGGSLEHLARLDALIGEAVAAAPDAAFLITGDHGMNPKTRCWDLQRACAARGLRLKYALSVEKDPYIKHHRTFGGCAWVWLQADGDRERATEILTSLPGVEAVLARAAAASRLRLDPATIGDLVVLGDRDTVFGDLEGEHEDLPEGYRSHGSLHERDVPLIMYNYHGEIADRDELRFNCQVSRPIFSSWIG